MTNHSRAPASKTPPRGMDAAGARRYLSPFREAWTVTQAVVSRLPRWRVTATDSLRGEIKVEVGRRFSDRVDRMLILLTLDDSGLTRIEVRPAWKAHWTDFGRGERRVRQLLRVLDRSLQA